MMIEKGTLADVKGKESMVVLHGNGGCGFGEEGFKGKDESS